MTNEKLKQRFDQTLKPLQYRKKGNKWLTHTEALTKVIELQKSGYTNLYYVNYGINFNQLDFKAVNFHVFGRLDESLDLEKTSDPTLTELSDKLLHEVTETLNPLCTIEDVMMYIKTLPTLNILPLRVKAFLKLK